MELTITAEAVATYVALLKGRFGVNLGRVIEEVLYDSMNMDFEIPKEWNDAELAKWAEMDLSWNAYEGEEEGELGGDFAEDIFASNLLIFGIEEYFI